MKTAQEIINIIKEQRDTYAACRASFQESFIEAKTEKEKEGALNMAVKYRELTERFDLLLKKIEG